MDDIADRNENDELQPAPPPSPLELPAIPLLQPDILVSHLESALLPSLLSSRVLYSPQVARQMQSRLPSSTNMIPLTPSSPLVLSPPILSFLSLPSPLREEIQPLIPVSIHAPSTPPNITPLPPLTSASPLILSPPILSVLSFPSPLQENMQPIISLSYNPTIVSNLINPSLSLIPPPSPMQNSVPSSPALLPVSLPATAPQEASLLLGSEEVFRGKKLYYCCRKRSLFYF